MTRFLRILYSFLFICGCFLLQNCSERKSDTLFTQLSPGKTKITFANRLTQTREFNIIEYLYFYNGGGVATGDIDNDGLTDIYFSANQTSNKLYLNKGDLVFEDITAKAGVEGVGNWKTGVSMTDVNGDGYLDIFSCGVGNYKQFDGENALYINNGDLTFTDRTEEYGLKFKGFSTHASFFDYDNDGDLDLYLLNHSVHTARSYGHARLRFQSDRLAGDKLFRNELIPHGKNRFTEVTSQSGIYNSQLGYGLGIGVSDLNFDGFLDIYVSNDFHENDYLYINSGDGKFSEEIAKSMPHVSRFSMGNDIADINNDGLAEIITLDMLPRAEEVIKTTAGEDPYDIYKYKLNFGYHHQFARNSLQLNRGVDTEGKLLFSDIAPLAGVEASDWSWAPLLADFDNDGNKDLFIANGILTRPNDLDYINFISTDSAQRYYSYDAFVRNMPSGKVPNLFFRNLGQLHFADSTNKWIGQNATFSTGAAYADLDNDGDLDLVINNVNDVATVYRNDTNNDGKGWLQFELRGQGSNPLGIGAKVIVYSGNQEIYHEQLLSRGWQSSVSPIIHVGLPSAQVDSVCIIWPNRKFQILTLPGLNQRMVVYQKHAHGSWDYGRNPKMEKPILIRHGQDLFMHKENDFNAFNAEKLIPHMISTQGPDIAVGDVNGDSLEDFVVGGAAGQSAQMFLQRRSGNFFLKREPALEADSLFEDTGCALFDADGDGTADLIIVNGGQESARQDAHLQPRLYLNNGAGSLKKSERALPEIFLNASCVKPGDFDGDGDIDLFIGGRVVAGQYGISPESFLLANNGKAEFTNVSAKLKGAQGNRLGMVTDAVWTDLNDDGRPDLLVAGEWMPVSVLIQDELGNFFDKTIDFGLDKTHGWWNTLEAADFDNDGDIDFVAGNLGLNSRLRAADDQPVTLYIGDMDNNGGTDHLLTYFNGGQQYPFISRDQLVKQVPSFKRKFLKYDNFRTVRREHIIPEVEIENYIVREAYTFASAYLENRNGKFFVKPLPVEAQMFPVFSFCPGDFNGDGKKDLLAVGNLYAVQPDLGRYDAGYGLMMLGDGKGNFQALTPQASGFLVEGEGRVIQTVKSAKGNDVYVVGRNNDSLLLFGPRYENPKFKIRDSRIKVQDSE